MKRRRREPAVASRILASPGSPAGHRTLTLVRLPPAGSSHTTAPPPSLFWSASTTEVTASEFDHAPTCQAASADALISSGPQSQVDASPASAR